jgi:hypothetical protein
MAHYPTGNTQTNGKPAKKPKPKPASVGEKWIAKSKPNGNRPPIWRVQRQTKRGIVFFESVYHAETVDGWSADWYRVKPLAKAVADALNALPADQQPKEAR